MTEHNGTEQVGYFYRTDVRWKPSAQINAGDFILVYKDDDARQAEPVRVLEVRADTTSDRCLMLVLDRPEHSLVAVFKSTAVALPSEEWKDMPEQLLPGELE